MIKLTYKNQFVLTTEQLAIIFKATPTNLKTNFFRNKEYFDAGDDFFTIEGDELKAIRAIINVFENRGTDSNQVQKLVTESNQPQRLVTSSNQPVYLLECPDDPDLWIPEPMISKFAPKIYLWTLMGMTSHAKLLTTPAAWAVHKRMRQVYFDALRGNLPPLRPTVERRPVETHRDDNAFSDILKGVFGEKYDSMWIKPSELNRDETKLTLYGQRVWTLKMLAAEFGIKKTKLYQMMKCRAFERPADWFVTNLNQKHRLELENARRFDNALCLVTERGRELLRQMFEVRRLAPPKTPVEVSNLRIKVHSAAASLQAVVDLFDDF